MRSPSFRAFLAVMMLVAGLFFVGSGPVAAEAPTLDDAGSVEGAAFFLAVPMTGANEVPPVATSAVGMTIVASFGTAALYRLYLFNFPGHTAAHIHCAPAGVNGPVGVTLPFTGMVVIPGGVYYQGVVLAPDAGNGCGWTTWSDVEVAMRLGEAYVNVHSSAHPGGQIRGQLVSVVAGEAVPQ